jgi:glyoxylase-like metal-dependent hydrolase (beta-lactamase superfamily II)
METNVLGHENAAEIMRNRPTTARGQDNDAGADWEPFNLPVSIRWAVPDMTYSDHVTIYWDDAPIIVTHQPGSHFAGSWLRYEAEKIIFVGDSVVLGQPPFLAWSELDRWLEDLAWLSSDEFKGYKIISSRNGLITKRSVERMANLLGQIKEVVEDLAQKSNRMADIISSVPSLLKKLNFEKEMKELYQNRLIWGLEQYLRRHYPEKNEGAAGANK